MYVKALLFLGGKSSVLLSNSRPPPRTVVVGYNRTSAISLVFHVRKKNASELLFNSFAKPDHQVIDYYLDTLIFPETMEHRGLKLSANGQDVGGDMLFKVKLGFSGTPSDLLPLELGKYVILLRSLE